MYYIISFTACLGNKIITDVINASDLDIHTSIYADTKILSTANDFNVLCRECSLIDKNYPALLALHFAG